MRPDPQWGGGGRPKPEAIGALPHHDSTETNSGFDRPVAVAQPRSFRSQSRASGKSLQSRTISGPETQKRALSQHWSFSNGINRRKFGLRRVPDDPILKVSNATPQIGITEMYITNDCAVLSLQFGVLDW